MREINRETDNGTGSKTPKIQQQWGENEAINTEQRIHFPFRQERYTRQLQVVGRREPSTGGESVTRALKACSKASPSTWA